MNSLETLFFPDTVITMGSCSPLFLFYNLVHFLQPVEMENKDRPAAEPPNTFMEKGFCQGHTPAPLGTDRNRFLRLVHDIESRKDDYATQLSSLTIAAMSAPKNSGEDSKQQIMASLLGIPDGAKPTEGQTTDKQAELWQARLVLAIGEILDREEAEISDALINLDTSKAEMLDCLLGKDQELEDDALFTDLEQLREKVHLPRSGTIKNRVKAWLSLFQADRLPDWWLWTTNRMEAAEILLEMYQKKTDQVATLFWQLELPEAINVDIQENGVKIDSFRKEVQPFICKIAEKLNNIVRMERSDLPDPKTVLVESGMLSKQWATFLDAHFPAKLYPRTTLSFFLLHDMCFRNLTKIENGPNDSSNTKVHHAILAVVGQWNSL
jgi:hypothetical protein